MPFKDVHHGMVGITAEERVAARAGDLAILAAEGVRSEHAWPIRRAGMSSTSRRRRARKPSRGSTPATASRPPRSTRFLSKSKIRTELARLIGDHRRLTTPGGRAVLIAVGFAVAGCGGGTATPAAGSGDSGWTAVSGDTFAGSALNDVATFGKGFVTVGSAPMADGQQVGGVWTSADGSSWTGAVPTTPFKDATIAVASAVGDGIVALGMPCSGECYGFESWSTPDASVWSGPVKAPGSDSVVPTSFVARGTLMIGIGDELVDVSNAGFNGRVFTTPDGKAWSSVPDIAAMHDSRLSAIAAGAGGLVIVGSTKTTAGRAAAAWWSKDGTAWTRSAADPSFTDATLSSVVQGTSGFIAVGSIGPDGAVWTSTDGQTWAQSDENGVFAGSPLVDIATNGEGFVAVGGDAVGGSAWTSADGARWTPVPAIPGSAGAKFRSVAVGKTSSVIVGRPGTSGADAGLVWLGPLP